MAIGIYKITNPKGAIYIGSSRNIEKRWGWYMGLRGKSQRKLYNSFIKYGANKHVFEIVELCEIESLLKLEREYALKFDVLSRSNLNLRIPKYGDSAVHCSDETRLKMSISKMGVPSKKKGVPATLEARAKMSAVKMGLPSNRKGRKSTKPSPLCKIILDTCSGVFYNSILEAAESISMKRTTLNEMLIGRNRNRTNLIYA